MDEAKRSRFLIEKGWKLENINSSTERIAIFYV